MPTSLLLDSLHRALQTVAGTCVEVVFPGQLTVRDQVQLISCCSRSSGAGSQVRIVIQFSTPVGFPIAELRRKIVLGRIIPFGISCSQCDGAIQSPPYALRSLRHPDDCGSVKRYGLLALRLNRDPDRLPGRRLSADYGPRISRPVLKLYEKQRCTLDASDLLPIDGHRAIHVVEIDLQYTVLKPLHYRSSGLNFSGGQRPFYRGHRFPSP